MPRSFLVLLSFLLAPIFTRAATLSNSQLSLTLTPDGIQSITLAGRIITAKPVSGFPTHQGFYASRSFPPARGRASLGQLLSSTLASNSDSVTITDQFPKIAATYIYRLQNSDILLHATLRNNDTLPYANPILALPTIAFSSAATGDIRSWDASYIQANSAEAHHPGIWCPLAVSYVRDKNYGVALHCKSHFDSPTLFNIFGTAPNTIPAASSISLYFFDSTVAPGSSMDIDVTIHLTTATDLPSLVSSYVRDFRIFAGPLRYKPDDRPWLRFTSFDPSFVTPQNPLGFNGASRRFDTPLGIQRFEDLVYAGVGVTQGTIFWQPQGVNPRGVQYRPDFNVWPPSVAANLPSLIQWYNASDLKFGLCARCGKYIVRASPTADDVRSIDPDNPRQMSALLARFDAVQKLGVRAYYFDDIGTDLTSYRIIRQIRDHLGPNIPTYSEFTSDLLLPYSGVYTQFNAHSAGGGPPDGGTIWYGPDTLAIFRLLYPRSSIIAADITTPTGTPFVTPRQLARWKLTPIVEDNQARAFRPFFTDLIQNYQQNNLWK